MLEEPQPYKPLKRLEVDEDDFPRETVAFLAEEGVGSDRTVGGPAERGRAGTELDCGRFELPLA